MSELDGFYHVDGQPHVEFEYDDELYDLNWENTQLYLHHPPYEQIDHLFFIEFDEDSTAMTGIYMFRQTIDRFNNVVKQLVQYNYRITKSPLPAEIDTDAWVSINTRDLQWNSP